MFAAVSAVLVFWCRMKAIHIICRREGTRGGFKDLERVAGENNIYRSSCWALHNPNDLIGGWLYLHPDGKNAPSGFGGVVRSFDACKREAATEDGIAFVFEARKEGRGQRWRGANHGMAWTGGIVEATYPHEIS